MRRLAAVITLAATLFVVTGCNGLTTGNPNPPLTPTATSKAPTGTSTGGPGPTTPPVVTTTGPQYPATAQAYSEKLLTAWGQLQVSVLADLTTPAAQTEILAISAPPNQAWTFQRCDGAAGSSYCSFLSKDGDVITVRVINETLGKAHAVSEVKFDPTVYAADAKEYVRAFVEAWRNQNSRRMLALSSQAEVDYFTPITPPTTYTICTLKSGTLWNVRVYNSGGVNHVVKVTDATLGTKGAIASHVTPPIPNPQVCA